MGWATFWAFSRKLIWSPWPQHCSGKKCLRSSNLSGPLNQQPESLIETQVSGQNTAPIFLEKQIATSLLAYLHSVSWIVPALVQVPRFFLLKVRLSSGELGKPLSHKMCFAKMCYV
jgi:hypothetical protein